jgi:hypothetical protein
LHGAWALLVLPSTPLHPPCPPLFYPPPPNVTIQDERGVSRDEMAAALLEVAEGRVPKDRLALKCLLEDVQVICGGGGRGT